jgi:WD40 repeat protein
MSQSAIGSSATLELVRDALRFMRYFKQAIESYPLQVYNSALVFSPHRSLIHRCFTSEAPQWVVVKPGLESDWSACVQTLEGHSGGVNSVVFSTDSSRLASASHDKTVKIWDASSSKCVRTLEGHSDWVSSVVFSADSSRLASASDDKTVKIWDASSGKCVRTLEGHSDSVSLVVFSADSSRLASASDDKTVKIWDASSGKCVRTLEGHSVAVSSVVL